MKYYINNDVLRKMIKAKVNKRKIMLSILSHINPVILGIEKTVSFRSNFVEYADFEHFMFVLDPVLIPDLDSHFKNRLEMKEHSTIVLPNLTSNIGSKSSTYSFDDYLKDHDYVSFTKINDQMIDVTFTNGIERLNVLNGIVLQSVYFEKEINKSPKSFSLFSSKRYLTKDYQTNEIFYYNDDQSISLIIKDNDWYDKEYQKINKYDFLLSILDMFKPSVIIRDNFNIHYSALRNYATKNDILYVGYLHYSPFGLEDHVVESVTKADYDLIVSCNPDMIKDIKTDRDIPIIYIPPIFVEDKGTLIKTDKRFLMLTSNTPVKRNDEIFDWISRLDNIEVDVYGLEQTNRYKNITFMGHQSSSNIDWSKYIGYISNSLTEAFSVALVESLSNGLKPIVYDSDYAHRSWVEKSCRYSTFEEFKKLIYDSLKDGESHSFKVMSSFEEYVDSYRRLATHILK